MSGLHNAIGLHDANAPDKLGGKWSPRKRTMFIVGSCTLCWSLLIGKAALIL